MIDFQVRHPKKKENRTGCRCGNATSAPGKLSNFLLDFRYGYILNEFVFKQPVAVRGARAM